MICGAILAGGRSSRMGEDKAVMSLAGQSLLAHVKARLEPQVEALVVVGGVKAWADEEELAWAPDAVEGSKGPLAGVLAALNWAGSKGASALVTSPVDTPFLPSDLVMKLTPELKKVDVCFAAHGGRAHYLTSAWRTDLSQALENFLKDAENLSIRAFAQDRTTANMEFPAGQRGALDPFLNINAPKDLAKAAAWLSRS